MYKHTVLGRYCEDDIEVCDNGVCYNSTPKKLKDTFKQLIEFIDEDILEEDMIEFANNLTSWKNTINEVIFCLLPKSDGIIIEDEYYDEEDDEDDSPTFFETLMNYFKIE
jgi:hypothetical protein